VKFIPRTFVLHPDRDLHMLALVVGGSQALLVTQAPLVPGSAVAARTAAPLMESGGPLRATSLAERRKLKLETGARAALMPMRVHSA
jgi:hypothetical protein